MNFFNYRNSLISRLRNGDEQAFEEVYWNYRDQVFGIALRYLKDPDFAEDAVQDVFLKVWSYREKIDSEKSFEGLLFTTLKNHLLNLIKSNESRILRQFQYAEIHKRSRIKPDDHLYTSQLQEIIQEGLLLLPKGKRTIFKMKRIEGYSNREIAEELNISVHTVKSQLNKANQLLQRYVSKRIDTH